MSITTSAPAKKTPSFNILLKSTKRIAEELIYRANMDFQYSIEINEAVRNHHIHGQVNNAFNILLKSTLRSAIEEQRAEAHNFQYSIEINTAYAYLLYCMDPMSETFNILLKSTQHDVLRV